jgi:DtxR family Mn-dependent transcriptional regulator
MSHTHTDEISESEQMYLIATALLIEDGVTPPVSLTALAQARDVLPVSVNQMVRKLADLGLVIYLPYKGIEFTDEGATLARRVLRYRRLWETLLVTKLGMPIADADALACRFEHLTSDDVADRLAAFLDHPTLSPQGRPIPAETATLTPVGVPLNTLHAGQQARIIQLPSDPIARDFLAQHALITGALLQIEAVSRAALLVTYQQQSLALTQTLAATILVQLVGSPLV